MSERLPIETILPEVIDQLQRTGRLVLQAPPGAGKTTRVPLAVLEAGLAKDGKIIMLEPRRLATRSAAERMAQTIGQSVGESVGYRIRGDSKVGRNTKIEVVTEGILTRMLQDKPDLPGVSMVVFDEFHERSLNADLGLALCLEVAEALRDDLRLIVMSATLDAEPVAQMMQAPILTSEGRSFPVEDIWLTRPLHKDTRLERAVSDIVLDALTKHDGSVLVFLPGEAEIRRTEALLTSTVPDGTVVRPLFGAMNFQDQRAAIAPPASGRKVVLATSIAETSLTIEGITVVVDAGRSRRSEFDPVSGMARLVTQRVTRAEAVQRAGRAGRMAPGVSYKLWTRGEDGALADFPPPEISVGDLTTLALELAVWGSTPAQMRFVTPPNEARLAEAQSLLAMLGALDAQGRITDHGRALARLPLHPRLAHMVRSGGGLAPLVAALLSERDILQGAPADLTLRISAAKNPKAFAHDQSFEVHRGTLQRVQQEARRLQKNAKAEGPNDPGVLAALAYPDRIALRRAGDAPRFILSGGKGAYLKAGDPLAGQRLLVATDLDGDPREARIRQAIALDIADLRAVFRDQIIWQKVCLWSRRDRCVLTREQETFGALVLDDRPWREAPQDQVAQAMIEGIQHLGLSPSRKAQRLMTRAGLLQQVEDHFPDLSEPTLLATAEDWLAGHLTGIRTASQWKDFDILPALETLLGWSNMQKLDREVPAHFTTPLGRRVAIDYEDGQPRISLRLQELFGVTRHPTVAGRAVQVTLLSPAQRPVQVTEDLPGFWASSYADVRKDMRGRYPKHPWPEDPTQADPTLRAKPRKG